MVVNNDDHIKVTAAVSVLDVSKGAYFSADSRYFYLLKRENVCLCVCLSKKIYADIQSANRLTPWFLVVVLIYPLLRTLNPAIQELG